MSAPMLDLDGFAGPGGWSTGRRLLDAPVPEVGIEWDAAACRTRAAAGHLTIRADVAEYPTAPFFGRVRGKISSPSCQAWSRAGGRKGLLDQERIFGHAEQVRRAGMWVPYSRDGWHDERSPLVLEPLRWIADTRPQWVALEQVPDVLPFWRVTARILARWGYSTWCGELSAEQYGVPQTRKRAVLIASRVRDVAPPGPTHQRYVAGEPARGSTDLFGGGLLPWVSAAQALGWADAEGVMYRRTRGAGMSERHGGRPDTPVSAPAPTITSKSRSDRWVIRTNNDSRLGRGLKKRFERTANAPSPTVTGSVRSWRYYESGVDLDAGEQSELVTVQQAAILQSFPADYPWHGSRTAQHEQVGNAVPPLLAAHVLTAASGDAWRAELGQVAA